MDIEVIIEEPIIQTALRACQSLKVGGRFRTALNPELIDKVLRTSVDCPEAPENFILDVGRLQSSQLYNEICLTSGGADSTIFWMLNGKPKGLYIDIGQVYASREIYALEALGVDFIYVDLRNSELAIKEHYDWKHIIPGRNFLFLTIAAELVKDQGTIYFGVVSGEGFFSGRGDKSQKFIKAFQHWYQKVTGKIICIDTMVEQTKAGWLKLLPTEDQNIIRTKTVTCFSELTSNKWQCGRCQACLRKYLSFVTLGQDIKEDFETHPMIGGNDYVKKYLNVLDIALKERNFEHYSEQRCREDLAAIKVATEWLGVKC